MKIKPFNWVLVGFFLVFMISPELEATLGSSTKKVSKTNSKTLEQISNPKNIPKPSVEEFQIFSGSIEDNLYSSGLKAGLAPSIILELSDIFSSQIDFTTDLRKGDTFSVIVSKNPGSLRRILAARLNVNGETYEAYYFKVPNSQGAYYDENGNSLEKSFLKAPLQYRRISSFFTKKRFHPILKIYRPHFGIDYAAPMKTPVSSVGDGKVIFVGTKGGFGKIVEIKHDDTYTSSYGHLSKFAPKLKVGKMVKKGEVIGYVGMTGLATGPHLDFRFYEKGRPVDFTKISPTHRLSIPQNMMAQYQSLRNKYLAAIEKAEKRRLVKKP